MTDKTNTPGERVEQVARYSHSIGNTLWLSERISFELERLHHYEGGAKAEHQVLVAQRGTFTGMEY